MDSDDWEVICEYPFSQLVSSRDWLIQFKILHRFYLMPHRLHRIYQNFPPHCHTVTQSTTIPIPQQVDVCLLGLVEALAPIRAVRTLLGLLFYARNPIVTQ